VIVTPVTQFFPPSDHEPPLPGQMLDSAIVGCTWHRLLLDADIPMGTSIGVRVRAADDPSLLPYTLWQEQPALYRRSDGAELPYYDPYAQQRAYATRLPDPALGPLAGTWELLFQNIQGRYLQLELTLEGTGRSTPEIRALRAWYPRFSYLEHYLPAIYREDPVNALFLERWLANVEGFYTHLEDQIEQFALMLDPRTAPADALEWLACWFGLVLDPLWSEERRRFMIHHLHWLYTWRGTIWGLELALRVYLDCTLTDNLFASWSSICCAASVGRCMAIPRLRLQIRRTPAPRRTALACWSHMS
jgi:phage tail-like protein